MNLQLSQQRKNSIKNNRSGSSSRWGRLLCSWILSIFRHESLAGEPCFLHKYAAKQRASLPEAARPEQVEPLGRAAPSLPIFDFSGERRLGACFSPPPRSTEQLSFACRPPSGSPGSWPRPRLLCSTKGRVAGAGAARLSEPNQLAPDSGAFGHVACCSRQQRASRSGEIKSSGAADYNKTKGRNSAVCKPTSRSLNVVEQSLGTHASPGWWPHHCPGLPSCLPVSGGHREGPAG